MSLYIIGIYVRIQNKVQMSNPMDTYRCIDRLADFLLLRSLVSTDKPSFSVQIRLINDQCFMDAYYQNMGIEISGNLEIFEDRCRYSDYETEDLDASFLDGIKKIIKLTEFHLYYDVNDMTRYFAISGGDIFIKFVSKVPVTPSLPLNPPSLTVMPSQIEVAKKPLLPEPEHYSFRLNIYIMREQGIWDANNDDMNIAFKGDLYIVDDRCFYSGYYSENLDTTKLSKIRNLKADTYLHVGYIHGQNSFAIYYGVLSIEFRTDV